MAARCLVTGATGFLGTNLVNQLQLDGGWEITASGMHGSETKYLDDLGVRVEFADICDFDEIRALVEGHDVVFHVAGDTSGWPGHRDRQRRINVDGARNVGLACLGAGVERMVHTSTIDVLGHDPTGTPITEATGRYNFDGLGYNYGDTKLEGERQLHELHRGNGLDVVMAYPGFMCGPYDYTLQLGRVFFDLRDGKLPGSPAGGSSFAHVADVARGHIGAARHGRSGESYALGGHNMTTHEFFGQMADSIGADRPSRVLPEWALVAYGQVLDTTSRLTKEPASLSANMARYMSKTQFVDCTKAIDDLGYTISSVDDMIADAVAWYDDNGFGLTRQDGHRV